MALGVRRWSRRAWGMAAGVLLATALATTSATAAATTAPAGAGRLVPAGRDNLQIFYSSPVLVAAGERVRIPVDVVCSTGGGAACPARVTLRAREAAGSWTSATSGARTPVFDVSAPVGRAVVGGAGAGMVELTLGATAPDGATATLPPAGFGPALRVYVAPEMRVLHVAAVPMGRVRHGVAVLSLPWGSGPARAGLAVGDQSAVVGPPSFDVDRRGRIWVLDPLQGRIRVFDRGRAVRALRLRASARSDLAVGADGTAYVLSRGAETGSVVVRTIAPDGHTTDRAFGTGVVSEVRAVGDRAFVHLLPADAWVAVGGGRRMFAGLPDAAGRQLLRVGTTSRVRIGTVAHGRVTDAVELRSTLPFGEVDLAASDGGGGYVVVVHEWQADPAADQYEVIRVAGGRVVETFAVPRREFAAANPASRFRLGPDGALYAMASDATGLRIVRFQMGGAR